VPSKHIDPTDSQVMWEFTAFSISDFATGTALHTDITCAQREGAWELMFRLQSF